MHYHILLALVISGLQGSVLGEVLSPSTPDCVGEFCEDPGHLPLARGVTSTISANSASGFYKTLLEIVRRVDPPPVKVTPKISIAVKPSVHETLNGPTASGAASGDFVSLTLDHPTTVAGATGGASGAFVSLATDKPSGGTEKPAPSNTAHSNVPTASAHPGAGSKPPKEKVSAEDFSHEDNFGAGPEDIGCQLGVRGVFGLKRRCPSRKQRSKDWTAYADMKAGQADTARAALEDAIKNNKAEVNRVRYDAVDPGSKTKYYIDLAMVQDPKYPRERLMNKYAIIAKTLYNDEWFKSREDLPIMEMELVVDPTKKFRVNESGFSVDGKLILALDNNRDNDARETLNWSDMVFQRYHDFFGDEGVKKLESILQVRVLNQDTVRTLMHSYQIMGKRWADWGPWSSNTGGEKVVFHASAPENSLERGAFDAALRLDNVRGVNWLLADHHTALGNKRIQSITVWPAETSLDEFDDKISIYRADMLISVG